MSRKIRFKVSVKELAFEFEGDAETGEQVQRGIERTLGGLVEMQNRAMGLPDRSDSNVIDAPSTPVRTKKRRRIAPTNGDGEKSSGGGKRGVPAMVKKLIEEGFFSEERSVAAVREALDGKGQVIKSNHISTVVQQFAQQELLTRRQNEEGLLVYRAKQ